MTSLINHNASANFVYISPDKTCTLMMTQSLLLISTPVCLFCEPNPPTNSTEPLAPHCIVAGSNNDTTSIADDHYNHHHNNIGHHLPHFPLNLLRCTHFSPLSNPIILSQAQRASATSVLSLFAESSYSGDKLQQIYICRQNKSVYG